MIELTTEEVAICNILIEANKHMQLDSTIRFAGGWVRDKLMGKESSDLDVCIDNMSGLEFATKVAEFLGKDKVGLIKANPDKSKHLETAVLTIYNNQMEFVGFRKETYAEDSRIPMIEKGDLLEDCYRRDFTINSLYYNISTQQVEDVSGKGIDDINNKIVRLMVPPMDLWSRMNISNEEQANIKSFTDDPLRILRAIRFATRFGFNLSDEIKQASLSPNIQTAFRSKVSRERIQIEFRKMLTGNSPVQALGLIKEFKLLDSVLMLPPGYLWWEMDQNNSHHTMNVWDHTITALGNLQILSDTRSADEDTRFAMNLAILLHDVGKLHTKVHGKKQVGNRIYTTYHGHEESSIKAAESILTKLPGVRSKEIDRVKKLIDCARRVNPNYTPSNEKCNLSRKAIGKFIRLAEDDWDNAIIVSMADAAAKKRNMLKSFDFTYYLDMRDKIQHMGPTQIRNMKPLLNGEEIIEIIGKSGPIVGNIIDKMIEWQLDNPDASKKDAIGYVKSFR